jgi:integrase/recombinase XerD
MSTSALPREVRPRAGSRYRKLPVVGPVLNDLLAWLRCRGYRESTIRNCLVRAARICRWLQRRRGPSLRGLRQSDLRAADDHFRKRWVEVATIVRMLGRFLTEQQLLPLERERRPSHAQRELQAFGTYLREVRGFSPSTVLGHSRRIGAFLQFLKIDERPSVVRRVRLDQIDAFLCQTAKTNNRFSMQQIVGSLRAFLRWQYAQGLLRHPLHQQIDTPRIYRLERLPRAWAWEQVLALLRSIDSSTPIGLRDFTVLYLASSYGLRSGELVRLTLDDIDWRAGTLRIRQTKTKQTLLLPLSQESRGVLSRYLSVSRPVSSYRELFLRSKAPAGPFAPTAVHDILERQIALSGLELPMLGSHALRHSLAVHLLRQGVCLPSIGATLGHRNGESTAIYLRLAIEDLREVGLPVPNGGKPTIPEPHHWKQKLIPGREAPLSRLGRSGFRCGLAESMRHYVSLRRALGRAFRSEETILRHWDAFLMRHFGKTCQVKAPMFQAWARTMTTLTATVRRQRMLIVRNFLLFHARRHPRTYVPDLKTFPKPIPRRRPRLVSATEMAQLLATASVLAPSHRNPLRAQSIRLALVLLFCCGLRRGELLRLRIRHFDPREKVLHVEAAKFHKTRLVPLPDSVADEVQRYLALRHGPLQPDAPLLSSGQCVAREATYSPHGLSENWQFLCLTTGVLNERGRPPRLHDLRHSFAVAALDRWYRQGVNVQSKLPHLATYLGHVSIVSTHYYLQLSPELGQSASQLFQRYAYQLFTSGDMP